MAGGPAPGEKLPPGTPPPEVRAPTEQAIEGPFYRPGAPWLTPPYTLVRRPGERGAVLVFSGTVAGSDGSPLPGAVLDLWQASAEGAYAPGAAGADDASGLFDLSQPAFNFRGRLVASADGSFEVLTRLPGAYRDPPGALGAANMRPAHLHARVAHPGFVTLTTQLFFEHDPHLRSDPAGAVRPGLVMAIERRADPADLAARGLRRPYFACHFSFVLAREP
jgi:catechol 1,2-dioxygenase